MPIKSTAVASWKSWWDTERSPIWKVSWARTPVLATKLKSRLIAVPFSEKDDEREESYLESPG